MLTFSEWSFWTLQQPYLLIFMGRDRPRGLTMLDTVYRVLTNLIYLVPWQVKQFKAREPHSQILAAGATKARKFDQASDVRYEAGWVTARRGALILTPEKLICGSWDIPLSTVTTATLLRIRSLFAKALILKISTDKGDHYQFGLQYDPAWERQTILKLAIEDARLKYSLFSAILRIILFIWLIWLIIQWLR
jgi:hypothetical protein